MSEKKCSLFFKNNFINECFYYFANLSHEKRNLIGEKISEYQGVYYLLFFNFNINNLIGNKLYFKREYKYNYWK